MGSLEGSIGRVSTITEDTGKAIGTINNAAKSLADEAVQLRGATQSLIQRLQAARLAASKKRGPRFRAAFFKPSNRGNIRRVGVLHADNMITAIHMMHFTGNAAGKIGQQIKPGAAHFFNRHIAPER